MTPEPGNVTPLPARRIDRMAPTAPEHLEGRPEPAPIASRGDLIRSRFLTGSPLLNIPEHEPLVHQTLMKESVSMMVGAPGCGKSFLAIDLACSTITGRPWQGLRTYGGGQPVVYMAGEGVRGVMERIKAWCHYHRIDVSAIVGRLYVLYGGLELQEDLERVLILEVLAEIPPPSLVIVDTLHRHARGAEENSSKDMGKVLHALGEIATSTQAHVLMVHHSGKRVENGARGSSALLGAVDTELIVSGSPPQGGMVKVTKQKDDEQLKPWYVRYEKAGVHPERGHLSLVALPTAAPPPIESAALVRYAEILGRYATDLGLGLKDWLAAINQELNPDGGGKSISRSTLQGAVKQLENSGQVGRVSKVGNAVRYVFLAEPPRLPLQ